MNHGAERLRVGEVRASASASAVAPIIGIVLVSLQAKTSGGRSIQSVTDLTFDNLARAWTKGSLGTSLGSRAIVALFAVPATTALYVPAGDGIGAFGSATAASCSRCSSSR
jgi:ABC-type spermidine/putrescine transport system permease subunit II